MANRKVTIVNEEKDYLISGRHLINLFPYNENIQKKLNKGQYNNISVQSLLNVQNLCTSHKLTMFYMTKVGSIYKGSFPQHKFLYGLN